MWTQDAAKVINWSGVGSLAKGNHADITIVDRNPLKCKIEDLPATKVMRTILAGENVFDSGDL
jgi:predicted amidohydrolase YtcJ